MLFWVLFAENRRLRSDLEARLRPIENLEGSFADKLVASAPVPLKRVLSLDIYLDVRFWVDTLQHTEVEMDEIKTRVNLPRDPSRATGVEGFDRMRYGRLRVRIREWRGGYTHIEAAYPLCPAEQPRTFDLYLGRQDAGLWQFDLPSRPSGAPSSGTVWLERPHPGHNGAVSQERDRGFGLSKLL